LTRKARAKRVRKPALYVSPIFSAGRVSRGNMSAKTKITSGNRIAVSLINSAARQQAVEPISHHIAPGAERASTARDFFLDFSNECRMASSERSVYMRYKRRQ